ncbi:MAG: hypothetical protein WD042_14815 [Phycisphaeraceae bacterium]
MVANDPRALLAVLAKLENLRDPARCQGLRQYQRWVVRGDATLHQAVDAGGIDRRPLAIQLRDVSWGGLGFVCDRPLHAKSVWRIHFLHQGMTIGHQCMVVRHCRLVRDNLYLLGGQFCIEAGLLSLLGGDPTAEIDGRQVEANPGSAFLAPGEVA